MMLLPNLIITGKRERERERNPSNFSSSSLLELNWLVSPSDSCREDDDGQILKMCLPFFPLLCLSIIFLCLLSVFSLSLQDHSWQTSLDWVQVKHLTWIPLGQGLYQVFQEELEVESLARRRKNEDTGIYTFLILSFLFFQDQEKFTPFPSHANDCLSMSLFFGIFLSYLFNWLKLKNKFI